MAGEGVATSDGPSIASAAVLPRIKTGPLPTSTMQAIAALEASHASPVRVIIKVAKDVVLDGAGPPLPGAPVQAAVLPRVLVLGANVAPSLGRPAGGVPRRSAGAPARLVPGVVVATPVPAPRPRRA